MSTYFMNVLGNLKTKKCGQGMTEYGLILALIVMVGLVVFPPFSSVLKEVFTNVKDTLALK